MPVSGYIWLGLIGLFFTIEFVAGVFFHTETQGRTYSSVIRGWAVVGLAMPFGWGVLAGHFFHPSNAWDGLIPGLGIGTILITAAPIAIMAAIDVLVAIFGDQWVYPRWTAPLMLGIGAIWGALMWPV